MCVRGQDGLSPRCGENMKIVICTAELTQYTLPYWDASHDLLLLVLVLEFIELTFDIFSNYVLQLIIYIF